MQRGLNPVRQRASAIAVAKGRVFVSSVVAFELWFGVLNSGRVESNELRTLDFLAGFGEPLSFTEDDARVAGQLRAQLQSEARPIGPFDTLIAGQALSRDMILVTANVREFSRVPGLR